MIAVETAKPRTTTPLSGIRPSSAKALLLVVLGEFIWPRPRPAWSASLLRVLAELDIEANAARKALHRTAESGLIEAHREGRRVRWSLTAKAIAIMNAGWDRTYGWEDRDTSWDGRWLVVSVTVPESQRNLRHHLQTRLTWAGLGSPVPGQWLTTHSERGEDVAGIVGELGLAEQSHSFVGTVGPLGDISRLVRAAWDLDALAADYRSFIDTYTALAPSTDRDYLRARIQLVQDWRRFPYVDPDLPREFLPDGWPGFEASTVFRDRHAAWATRSLRHWNRITDDG